MESLFKDIMTIRGVQGIVLLSGDGRIVFESEVGPKKGPSKRYTNWRKLLDVIQNAREADFVFENGRLYLRRTGSGFLLVSMDSFASIAMVKLNCDIVLPQLAQSKHSKGLKGFFKR
jgi:hypothetical protein